MTNEAMDPESSVPEYSHDGKRSDIPIDPKVEAKLVRKLDMHIIPIIMALYLLSFLDRVNIGNARLYGLEEDLGLKGGQYQTAVSILFVTYLLSEVPSNLILKKFTPSRWIAFIAVSWGIIATLTGVTKTYGGLIACRLLLGAVEGGLFPGMLIYTTQFYSKAEIGLRIGYLFVSAALAGACGGLLAFAIGSMDGVAGQRGWRWILILEGIPTFVLGIITWFALADSPETAWYLTSEEKDLMVLRRRREVGQTKSAQEFHWDDANLAFKDWKVWTFSFAQFGTDTVLYGASTFLPTIIKGINPKWKPAIIQVLTIPVYTLGAITYLVCAWLSDKQQRRGLYTCLLGSVSVLGYVLLISNTSSGVHFFGCFLVVCGLYVCVGIPLAWLASNNPRFGKRTAATGLQLTIGNSAGILAPYLYPNSEAPRYRRGHAVTLGLLAAALLVFGAMSLHFAALNRQRLAGGDDDKVAGMSSEQIEELGDRNPKYVYTT